MVLFLLVAAVGLTGCSVSSDNNREAVSQTEEDILSDAPAVMAEHTEVIKAGTTVVYLDEVRYYAYNTQATYEAYYMAEEKELDWDRQMSVGVTLEEAVKSTILDSICEREAIVACADEYNVHFKEKELMEVSEKVNKYFSETNENLLKKTDVSRERMKEIFQKDALYEKVKAKMNKKEEGKSEEVYKKWKKVNNVTTNEYWDAINFDKPIW